MNSTQERREGNKRLIGGVREFKAQNGGGGRGGMQATVSSYPKKTRVKLVQAHLPQCFIKALPNTVLFRNHFCKHKAKCLFGSFTLCSSFKTFVWLSTSCTSLLKSQGTESFMEINSTNLALDSYNQINKDRYPIQLVHLYHCYLTGGRHYSSGKNYYLCRPQF